MLINQDFAQSEPKSPAKRKSELVGNATYSVERPIESPALDPVVTLLQETVTKIEGAYAPSTIRAYR